MSATRLPGATPSRSITRSASPWASRVFSSEYVGEVMPATGRSGAGKTTGAPCAPACAGPARSRPSAIHNRARRDLVTVEPAVLAQEGEAATGALPRPLEHAGQLGEGGMRGHRDYAHAYGPLARRGVTIAMGSAG